MIMKTTELWRESKITHEMLYFIIEMGVCMRENIASFLAGCNMFSSL